MTTVKLVGHRGTLLRNLAMKAKDQPTVPASRSLSPSPAASGHLPAPRDRTGESRLPLPSVSRRPDGRVRVTLHRGKVLKEAIQKPSDFAQPMLTKADLPRKIVPVPYFALAMDDEYRRYKTAGEIREAIRALPEVQTEAELVHQVQNFLAEAHARIDPRKPTVVLIGEPHGSPVANMMEKVAMAQMRQLDHCSLLLEATPESLRNVEQDVENLQAAYEAAEEGSMSMDSHNRAALGRMGGQMNIHFAQMMGFEVRGIDPLKDTAKHEDQRESAMVQSIKTELPPVGGTAFVVAGGHHFGRLYEQLKGRANVIGLCTVNEEMADHDLKNHSVRRLSYMLAKDEVFKLKSSALETADFDYFAFTQRLLAVPAAPADTGSDGQAPAPQDAAGSRSLSSHGTPSQPQVTGVVEAPAQSADVQPVAVETGSGRPLAPLYTDDENASLFSMSSGSAPSVGQPLDRGTSLSRPRSPALPDEASPRRSPSSLRNVASNGADTASLRSSRTIQPTPQVSSPTEETQGDTQSVRSRSSRAPSTVRPRTASPTGNPRRTPSPTPSIIENREFLALLSSRMAQAHADRAEFDPTYRDYVARQADPGYQQYLEANAESMARMDRELEAMASLTYEGIRAYIDRTGDDLSDSLNDRSIVGLRLNQDVFEQVFGRIAGKDALSLAHTNRRIRAEVLPMAHAYLAEVIERTPPQQRPHLRTYLLDMVGEHGVPASKANLVLMPMAAKFEMLWNVENHWSFEGTDMALHRESAQRLWDLGLNRDLDHRAGMLSNLSTSWFPSEEIEARAQQLIDSAAPLYEQNRVVSFDEMFDTDVTMGREQVEARMAQAGQLGVDGYRNDPYSGVIAPGQRGRTAGQAGYGIDLDARTPLWKIKNEVSPLMSDVQRGEMQARIMEMEAPEVAAIGRLFPRHAMENGRLQGNGQYADYLVQKGFTKLEACYVAGALEFDSPELGRTDRTIGEWRLNHGCHTLRGYVAALESGNFPHGVAPYSQAEGF